MINFLFRQIKNRKCWHE